MEILTSTNRERLVTIAENYINDILEDRGNSNIEDLASAFANAGFTKSEFFQILDKYYLNDYTWAEETTPTEKVNTETGEGVFWKEYTEDEEEDAEEVDIGDSDCAILETALTQIGIPYTWAENLEGGCIFVEEVEDGKTTGKTVAEIYFTEEGKFNGLS